MVHEFMCWCQSNYQRTTSRNLPIYKITHALLSFEFPLSDWLFLASPPDGAWAGAVWVFPFVSPIMARTSDTYRRTHRINDIVLRDFLQNLNELRYC